MCAVIPTLTQNCTTKLNIFLDKETLREGLTYLALSVNITYIKRCTLHIMEIYLVLNSHEVEVSKGFSLTQISMLNHCSTT
jgi:hypothetical protein